MPRIRRVIELPVGVRVAAICMLDGDPTARTEHHDLQLDLHVQASELQVTLTNAGTQPHTLDALGVRLYGDATRLLVDGYHSWDWAGTRNARTPGRGWWSGLWGSPHDAIAVRLLAAPAVGALQLRWSQGHLDLLCCGTPLQAGDRTGDPTPLRASLAPGEQVVTDAVDVRRWNPGSTGCGLPSPTAHTQSRLAGWMSWNCLGGEVTPADLLAAVDLTPSGATILLDDGWMPWWGDWWERADFGATLATLAQALRTRQRGLGLWLAPFLVDPRSETARDAAWLLRDHDNVPVIDRRPASPQHVLDGSDPAARDHLAGVARRIAQAGVTAVKLDFLYAGAMPGVRAAGQTDVQAMRAGLMAFTDAFRAHAGVQATVLASGAPAPLVAGICDSCRSGGDAVVAVPTRNAPPFPQPHFLHGPVLLAAQRRNAHARAWLWGDALPPDVDAVTLGALGILPPADDAVAAAWLDLADRSGGPLLVSDTPGALEQRRVELGIDAQRAVLGQAAMVQPPPGHPLEGGITPGDEDHFLSG